MQHLPALIYDLALILASAAVITLIFKKLKQPVVLGYIIAGLLIGPNFNFFPTVIETDGIKTWAEIGVLFLLFGLGLEFSFKKLVKLGGIVVVTAFIGVGMTMLSGYLIGKLLGWHNMDSLFLGGILAIASTTIIIRAFDELGVKSQKFASIVMGVLVVEDLVAVVLMVVLTTVSISRTIEGGEMAISIFKLVFFLVLWFISGIYFLPTFLKGVRNFMSEETLLIISLALCFLMVVFAANAGFSPALGAFVMGSILAETTKAEKIGQSIKSLKNLFGAIFFVSVGMLIDPKMLLEHPAPVILATLILLFAKPFFISMGAIITGQPLKVAVQSGMSLSQIGEFSFIIATLGITLNVTSDFLYPVAVAVSVITTFTTPFMIRLSGPVYKVIDARMPERWKNSLNHYGLGTQIISEASDWRKLLRSYFVNITVYSVIIIATILLCTEYLSPLIAPGEWNSILTTLISLVILSPFLWALAFKKTHRETDANLWIKPAQRGPLFMLLFLRMALAVFYLGFLFDRMFSPIAALAGCITTITLLILFRKKIKTFYGKIELRFLSNLNEREALSKEKGNILTPWDSHMATLELNSLSPFTGKTLMESKLRENFGINVAVIKRGDLIINVPGRDERLYPGDILSVIGTDEQITDFKEYLESALKSAPDPSKIHDVSLHALVVTGFSGLQGKSIRESGIRERMKGLVVGIERNDERILNPESDVVFLMNDIIWLVGDEKRIQVFIKTTEPNELDEGIKE